MQDFAQKKIKGIIYGHGAEGSYCRMSCARSDIIIFDEPTNGLNIVTARSVTDYLKKLRDDGKLVIISTHIMSEAEKLCDRIGMIIDGRKAAEGSLDEILYETNTQDLEDAFFALYKRAEGAR